jgi:putative oxidoreductase
MVQMSTMKVWSYTLARVLLGIIFLLHGAAKFRMGLENVAHFFNSLGLPGVLGYLVAFCELLGGIALILGIGTRYVAVLFFILMLGVILKVKLGMGLLGNGKAPGFELELALALVSLYLAAENHQRFAIDRFLSKTNPSS